MKKYIFVIALALFTTLGMTSCFNVEDENFKNLESITFNDVSNVINVNIGEELVFDKLEVTSELPVKYEWGYGVKANANSDNLEMLEYKVISDKAEVGYTFRRTGQYILRLTADNGESIEIKNFILNVNSGLDEGVLLLSNDESGKGDLTFVKTLTEDEVAADAKRVYPGIFNTINPDYTLENVTDMYMASHTASGVAYNNLVVATDDAKGSFYTMEPQTFSMLNVHRLREDWGTSALRIVGDYASGSTYNYAMVLGADNKAYRYDLTSHFFAVNNVIEYVDRAFTGVYHSSTKAYCKGYLYNSEKLYMTGSSLKTLSAPEGYEYVNMAFDADASKMYILLKSTEVENTYCIKTTTSSVSKLSDLVPAFVSENMTMDENSQTLSIYTAQDAYYTFDNKIYRWGLSTAPSSTPHLVLEDANEQIRSIATNYTKSNDGEDLLYVATYNPTRSGKKGSLYVYNVADNTLLESFEGICDDPVKVMYKFRVAQ